MLTHPTLERLPRIAHAFFTREGGTSEGIYASLNCGPGSNDAPEHVAENRRRALTRLGLAPDALVTVYQVHGRQVLRADRPSPMGDAPEADGLVTNRPGLAIGILTADCAPVLLADPKARVIGAAHAGWRGAQAGIVEAVVEEMTRLGAQAGHIHAVIGPCIGADSYEVGPEFPAPFLAAEAAHKRFFRETTNGRFHFDLAGYVAARLESLALGAIERVKADTCADTAHFFSYRRSVLKGEPDYGRALSAIALRED